MWHVAYHMGPAALPVSMEIERRHRRGEAENGEEWRQDVDSVAQKVEMFRLMTRIRFFEQSAYELYMAGKLPGFMHISIGQEATSVGSCSALGPDDYMISTHRGHGDTLAKGVSVEAAMAELFGRITGACRAKGGSMHIADFSKGILGANGIVAAGAPIAVGAALSIKKRSSRQVVLCFFGDGAMASGPIHESLNFAALWQLPIIFVRQNNQYAESTPRRDYQGMPDVVQWARGYGITSVRVDGNDVIQVNETVASARRQALEGHGPSFIESETYRWYGHNIGDPGKGRPEEEVNEWKAKDPIPRYRTLLVERGTAKAETLDAVEAEERQRLTAAIAAAEAESTPPLDSALEDVYSEESLGRQALRGVRR